MNPVAGTVSAEPGLPGLGGRAVPSRVPAETAAGEASRVRSSRDVLDALAGLVRGFPDDRARLSPGERVELAMLAATLASQVQGLAAMLLAEADAVDASMRAAGTPSATFLAGRTNLSKKDAAGLVYQARRLGAHPLARAAVLEGAISIRHANAVGQAMDSLPSTLTPVQTEQAETLLVDIARRATPQDVTRSAARVAEQVAPVGAAEREAARLAREREAAWRGRSLQWWRDQGSVMFKGSLPLVEGEAFTALIGAWAAQARRNRVEAQDPLAEEVTPWQRNADALIALVDQAGRHRDAPAVAGDRPVVVVTLNHDRLRERAAGAGLLPDGRELSAGELRRLCCDANLIPAVLGARSEPLDVGRAQRLVTPAIRRALTLRDQHCAFPSCDTPASRCDAHHITPWRDGGPTALGNLVLLCPHHHGLVEPDPFSSRDQWQVSIHTDGYPVFRPPARYPTPGLTRNANAPPLPTG